MDERARLEASPAGFTCPGCGAESRLEPIGNALTAGRGAGAASWEMWLRGRGDEVTMMVRVGRRVTERDGTGNVDVLAMLTDAWRAAVT
ncbi:hypothetical protein [Sphaerisporangium sp. TRM90804]|uniref:hypothetical protein n=1 Tax=Sphaerisporangium sp. TRM90804 TaxID=3031113 RepID=UPI00244BC6E8|nr:hypothetical protein [Sphaerisporangium sp. TRM90804]MDH2430672.1 hypothetical protein [Sphaerisporangium sp. TRM90804]